MPTLWQKFPGETFPFAAFSPAAREKFEKIFSTDNENSSWNKALRLLGLPPMAGPLLLWHEGAPYFNGTAMMALIGGGAVHVVKGAGGKYGFKTGFSPRVLCALVARHWKILQFLRRKDSSGGDKIAESIALGIALQALVLRLGADEKTLPLWLARPGSAPRKHRATLAEIQRVQMRRTALSRAWHDLFPEEAGSAAAPAPLPDWFWDAPPAAQKTAPATLTGNGAWQGLPVCAGRVAGIAVIARRDTDFAALRARHKAPLLLVFRQARPETTELFGEAAGLVFAEGGALSHACTVARERNIPAATGLGAEFFAWIKDQGEGPVWLSLDGGTGEVGKTLP